MSRLTIVVCFVLTGALGVPAAGPAAADERVNLLPNPGMENHPAAFGGKVRLLAAETHWAGGTCYVDNIRIERKAR